MRPILKQNKKNHKLWFLYALVFLICTIGIGVSLYIQYYKDENIKVNFGISDNESKQKDEYNELKAAFTSIFQNKLEILDNTEPNVQKLRENYDVLVTAYSYQKNEENVTLNALIPFFNINNEQLKKYNDEIINEYKEKAKTISESAYEEEIIYTVRYQAFLQNNILSLIIEAEYKEGSNEQKVTFKTYNYDLSQNKEITLQEILNIKNIKTSDANNTIYNEIKEIQKQNEILQNQGYQIYQRDINNDIYKIENINQFFIGQEGIVYIIFAYGNNDNTSEKDIVIFK